jgi:hypothetical protein
MRAPNVAAMKAKFEESKTVWEHPVDFNRARRREAGMTGVVWKWGPRPSPLGRYVRRNYNEATFTHPKTRRQRRERARITRAMRSQQ